MFNPLPVVLADMRRTRIGVGAVIALIAVAVALGVAISAQERALRQGSASAADRFDILIGAQGSPTQLVLTTVYLQTEALELIDGNLLKELAEDEGVRYASPLAFGDYYLGHPLVGVTMDFVTGGDGAADGLEGRPFQRAYEAVVGADVDLAIDAKFEPLHGTPDAADPESDSHDGFGFTVVGRLAPQGTPWDRAILVPVEAVWDVHGMPTGQAHHDEGAAEPARIGPPWTDFIPGVPAIVVKPVSVGDAYRLRGLYRTSETLALFPAEVLIELYDLLGGARDVLATIAVATQALVIAAVLLAVFASLAQRRRQVAVLRALGASRSYVFATVWCHITIMIAIGGFLGLMLGWAGALVLSQMVHAETGIALPVALGIQEFGMVLALIVIGGVLALAPSVLSYRQSVSSGLRA